jgi:hypothetical protein
MTLRRRTASTIGATLLLAAGLAACSDSAKPAVQPTKDDPSSLDSIEAARPRVGDCHAMTLQQVTETSAEDTSTDCLHRPTTITVAVGDLRVKGRKVAAGSPAAQDLMRRTCEPKAAAWLGAGPGELRTSRLTAVWFVPAPEQVQAGATWFRCDVIGFDRGDHLFPLPPPNELKGALKGDGGARYALCGTAKPGAKGFQRVTCSLKHSWRAISAIELAGPKAYPGVAAVRAGGTDRCSKQARDASGGAMKYDYGWEWPTKQQWAAGQHYGYCWAPA